MAYLSPAELVRVAGMRPDALMKLQQLMQAFENATGQRTFVPDLGGLRTNAQQAAIYAAHRGSGDLGPAAMPGNSRHEYGGAFDLNIIGQTTGDNEADARNPYYRKLAELARALGLTAGIGFSDPDPYHFQLTESLDDAKAAWASYEKKNASLWCARASALCGSSRHRAV